MPKIGKIALAVATAGLFTGALTAAAPAASAQSTNFTALVESVRDGDFLHKGPGNDVTLGTPSNWAFQEVAPDTYRIRAANTVGAPCLSASTEGTFLTVLPCDDPFFNQTWKLTPANPDQPDRVRIEAADAAGSVLEQHGPGERITLEHATDNGRQQWLVYRR
ncbi:RICIN domain-containing protein [Kitasatospora sp. NPDC101183]|uniref:RICIN domain-containing protein n=1 Tax=Kitasatospora sp. NPDC101183 TaxID=3364100 RepID=UPI00380A1E8B